MVEKNTETMFFPKVAFCYLNFVVWKAWRLGNLQPSLTHPMLESSAGLDRLLAELVVFL